MNILSFYRQALPLLLLLLLGTVAPAALANCTFSGGEGGKVTLQLPSVFVLEPDTPVGTVIYDRVEESPEVEVDCGGNDVQIYRGYLTLTEADARDDILPGVYKTNIPGIGIRAAASTEQMPTFTEEDLVRPWKYVGMYHGYFSNMAHFRAAAQLIVIGRVEEGMLDTSRFTSMEALDTHIVGEMRFSPTSVRITSNTCNLVDRNLYVPLKTVNAQDFTGQYSAILTDDSFRIAVSDCAAGTTVDYQFKSSGSTGVTNGTILGIAGGDTAASGVGIQILDASDRVLTFDQPYTAFTTTADKQLIEIPLKARYIKTGELKAGKVDAVATFDVFYR